MYKCMCISICICICICISVCMYLNRAFSAPRICTVEAGHLANEVREPAFWIRRAATVSPMRVDRLGATVAIYMYKYMFMYINICISVLIYVLVYV
jgi:hypothetical protein